jgi:putative endonuclease
MKLYYVYLLKCKDGTFYTGFTNNLERRFREHQLGLNRNCYTFSRRPLNLVFYQEFLNAEQAIYFEKKIKKWSNAKKEALAKDNWEHLKFLSECKNHTSHKNFRKDS